MDVRWVDNPDFNPERALIQSLDELGTRIRKKAAAKAGFSSTIPPNIVNEPAKRDRSGASVTIRLRKEGFKGHFFEKGTKSRYTKKGAHRGVGPKRPFMTPAKDEALREGLFLDRFL